MTRIISDPLETRVIELINDERAHADLEPVHTEVHLNSSAQNHSGWMAEEGILSHRGEEGSTPSDRAEDADFPMQDGSWKVTENIAYSSISGSLDESEIALMHRELMDSPTHKANILDPDVSYIGVGLSEGQIEAETGSQDAVFLTQNFGSSSQPALVQEEINGETVITNYINGEAVSGTSQPVPNNDINNDTDDTDDNNENQDEDDPQDADTASGGSCFVATAAYGDRAHPNVIILRRFRDEVLVRYRFGRAFIQLYWIIGPRMAKGVSHDRVIGHLARLIISPFAAIARGILIFRDR